LGKTVAGPTVTEWSPKPAGETGSLCITSGAVAPDDETLFFHVRDESRSSWERVKHFRDSSSAALTPDLAVTLAEFELHGATLRSLLRWYPEEDRVRTALADWEVLSLQLASQGLPIDA
jgi:hypothetical protein